MSMPFPSANSPTPPPPPRPTGLRRFFGQGGSVAPLTTPYSPPLPSSGVAPSVGGRAASGDTATFAANAASKSFRTKFGPLLGVLGATIAGWFMYQSYKGHQPIWEVNFANHHSKAEMNYLESTWAHWSGNPAFDELHHESKAAEIFGPWGIRTKMAHAHEYVHGFMRDVVLSNIIPIALGVASLYFGFGAKNIHNGVGKLAKAVMPKGQTNFAALGAKAFDGTVKGVSKTAGGFWSLFKNGKAPFTLTLGALGLFGLYQIKRSFNHQGQQDLFRGFVSGHGNNEIGDH